MISIRFRNQKNLDYLDLFFTHLEPILFLFFFLISITNLLLFYLKIVCRLVALGVLVQKSKIQIRKKNSLENFHNWYLPLGLYIFINPWNFRLLLTPISYHSEFQFYFNCACYHFFFNPSTHKFIQPTLTFISAKVLFIF